MSGFLLVSRKLGQGIRIILPGGGEIFVRFHEFDGRWAKLAVRAPTDCQITKVEGAESLRDTPAPQRRSPTSGGEGSGR